jgi:two-component system copper resistance phosphate regulon response regulator CusR
VRILVVEDHRKIAESIKIGLEKEGFEVLCAYDGGSALDSLESISFDCVLLDIMLPDISGYELCKYIRNDLANAVPIIMLTALDSLENKVEGFNCGADDYLPKPFYFKELDARIRAVIRRNIHQTRDIIQYGPFSYDPYKRLLLINDVEVQMSKRELELMELFLKNPQKVLSRDFIKGEIWGEDEEGKSNIVDVYILYLRKRLKPYGLEKSIKTYPQVGYILDIA